MWTGRKMIKVVICLLDAQKKMGSERTRLEYYLIFNVTKRDITQEVELFEFKIIISSVLDSLYPLPRDFLNVYKTKLFLCTKN